MQYSRIKEAPGRNSFKNLNMFFTSTMRFTFISVLLLSFSCTAEKTGITPGDGPLPIEERFPIDGIIDFSKLSNVQESDLSFVRIPVPDPISFEHSTHVKWAIMNDDKNVYIAIQWTDDDHNSNYSLISGPVDYDSIELLFDNDGDGTYENDENRYYTLAASDYAIAVDAKKSSYESDTVGNGYSFMKYHAGENIYQAEFLLPLEGDSSAESITANTRINFSINDHVVNDGTAPDPDTGFFTMLVFYDTDSSGWPVMPITESDPVARTPIPGNLEGLIIFTSTKDEPINGEIYSFNPQTKVVTRLTNNTLYEGTISLSHDRTRIAFMGASGNPEKSSTYADECEIYILTIADGSLERLTTNGYLDGHPAWSPDDTRIVFACYNPANWGGHIMLIDLSSPSADPEDLTLASELSANTYWCDENDPEFTPAGKIVFKTNRYAQADYYSAHGSYFTYPDSYVLQIALMNADGSNPIRITDQANVVDHDPVSNAAGTHTVFERLPGDYNYLETPGCFGPWYIVEAKLDGSCDESILVNDPWLNWLPVYDPTGNYIIYFRSCGYTETRLIRRSDNKDLGRFIPGITKIDYLDWK